MSKPTKYVLDDATQEDLETVMNWAQELCDLQKDDDCRDEMLSILLNLADKFDIKRSVVHVEEDYDEATGTATLTIRTEEEKPAKPKLTVVSDSTQDNAQDNLVALKDWQPDEGDSH